MPNTFSHERCAQLIGAIDGPEVTEHATVLAIIDSIGITGADFIELDERPGQFDHAYHEHSWHSLLRRVRNDPTNDLFDRLSANSAT